MLWQKINRKINKYRLLSYHKLYPSICELLDYRTNRHIVVIESDDWGAIRIPSEDVKKYFIKEGINMNEHPFERNDTLEMDSDLEALYDVLLSYQDYKGNHPVITANTLVANPDFKRIKDADYQSYFYEPIANTYLSYPHSANVPSLINSGIKQGIFYPQSHGREHFNVSLWLKALQNKDRKVLDAFERNMCVVFHPNNKPGNLAMIALKYDNLAERDIVIQSVKDGLNIFEDTFGFRSKSYVAPCYTWPKTMETMLANNGVEMIQTDRVYTNSDNNQTYYHYSGESSGGRKTLKYSVRNCNFEPSISGNSEEWKECLTSIESCFDANKIAVISSHRLNYVAGISQENRDNTLRQLKLLLTKICQKWPDVEFMNSAQIYNECFE